MRMFHAKPTSSRFRWLLALGVLASTATLACGSSSGPPGVIILPPDASIYATPDGATEFDSGAVTYCKTPTSASSCGTCGELQGGDVASVLCGESGGTVVDSCPTDFVGTCALSSEFGGDEEHAGNVMYYQQSGSTPNPSCMSSCVNGNLGASWYPASPKKK